MFGPLPNLTPGLRILCFKSERSEVHGGAQRTFIDATLSDGDALYAVPFLLFDEQGTPATAFPWHFRAASPELLVRIGSTAAEWYIKKGKPVEATLDFFAHDAQIGELLADSGEDGFAAAPGFTSAQTLMSVFDRYAHAATRAHGRRVLDLRAGVGTGAEILRAKGATVDPVSASALHRRVAHRYGREVHETPGEGRYDLVLALSIPFTQADLWLERARHYHEHGAQVLLSFSGDHVADFKKRALAAELMTGLAADNDVRYDETIVWFESERARMVPIDDLPAPPVTAVVKSLSILFVLRANAQAYPGGDSQQVYQTAAALRRRGHAVRVTLEEEPEARGFDIVHLTNMTMPKETLRAAKAVEHDANAVLLMPIFLDHNDESTWGAVAMAWAYGTARDEDELQRNIQSVSRRAVQINAYKPPPARNEREDGYDAAQRDLLKRVDFLVANAYSEVHRIYRYVDSSVPFAVVPSCGEPALYTKSRADEFTARYGLRDFILMAGRIESRKNQLAVAHCFRDSPWHLVMIGRNQNNVYGDLFRQYWPHNVTVLPHLPEEELAAAFSAARIVLIPSWEEVVSLSSINAALCEKPLVLSRNSFEHEYFGSLAHYCDAGNPADIARAVREADAECDARAADRAELAARARREWTWDRAAELLEQAYYRVLKDNPRGAARRSAVAV